jgi:hypothetical protein
MTATAHIQQTNERPSSCLSDKVAVVTGAARGIGRATASPSRVNVLMSPASTSMHRWICVRESSRQR